MQQKEQIVVHGNKPDEFLEMHKDAISVLGFWDEEFKVIIMKFIESQYKDHITINWRISDIVINGEKVLIKWTKNLLHHEK